MDYKKIGFGLGLFSIGLGLVELFAAKRVTRAIGVPGHEGIVKAFGAREMLAGMNLVTQPAVATNVWNRVAGDVMDLSALGLAARSNARSRGLWGATAFVVAATLVDVLTARGLDARTGKTFPTRGATT